MHDNPSAFPAPHEWQVPGMTLRDYFAGQALAGFLAADAASDVPVDAFETAVARASYTIADAMLAARKEQPNADR